MLILRKLQRCVESNQALRAIFYPPFSAFKLELFKNSIVLLMTQTEP